MKPFSNAFTLLELLVVIAVIATLAGVSLPVLARSQSTARVTQDLQNLRQLGAATAAFSSDNDGLLPQSSHQGPGQSWTVTLNRYLQNSACLRSPFEQNAHRAVSYAINDFLTSHPFGAAELDFSRRASMLHPAETLLLSVSRAAEGASDHFHFADGGADPRAFCEEVEVELANGAGHYLFVDGHVEARLWENAMRELNRQGSSFVRPQ